MGGTHKVAQARDRRGALASDERVTPESPQPSDAIFRSSARVRVAPESQEQSLAKVARKRRVATPSHTKRVNQPVAAEPADRGEDANAEVGGIQSVERAFAILREIARSPDGLRLVELGKRVNLRSSTTFHLVKTLVAMGYVGQIGGTKRYCIGRRMFTLAASALSEIGLVGIATPLLEELARTTGECSQLAVRSDTNCLVVAKTSGSGMFQFVEQMGNLRPAYCTALGKVLISGMPPAQLKKYLESLELRPFTPRTIVDPLVLQKEIDEVRRARFAIDDGEFDAEVRCVAVAVYDFTGQIAGAIGISGSVWRLSMHELLAKASQVRAAGRALSAELGYPGQP